MAMMKGHSADVVSKNVRDMVKAGYPQKSAVAAALSSARKSKKMAEGGIVVEDMDNDADSDLDTEANRSVGELQAMGQSRPDLEANPESEDELRMLARALQNQSERNEVKMAMGGLVQPEFSDETLGNKPSEDMSSPTEEPMSSMPAKAAELGHAVVDGVPESMGLSEEAKAAIAERKKSRRFR